MRDLEQILESTEKQILELKEKMKSDPKRWHAALLKDAERSRDRIIWLMNHKKGESQETEAQPQVEGVLRRCRSGVSHRLSHRCTGHWCPARVSQPSPAAHGQVPALLTPGCTRRTGQDMPRYKVSFIIDTRGNVPEDWSAPVGFELKEEDFIRLAQYIACDAFAEFQHPRTPAGEYVDNRYPNGPPGPGDTPEERRYNKVVQVAKRCRIAELMRNGAAGFFEIEEVEDEPS